jgi:hypothetical protein
MPRCPDRPARATLLAGTRGRPNSARRPWSSPPAPHRSPLQERQSLRCNEYELPPGGLAFYHRRRPLLHATRRISYPGRLVRSKPGSFFKPRGASRTLSRALVVESLGRAREPPASQSPALGGAGGWARAGGAGGAGAGGRIARLRRARVVADQAGMEVIAGAAGVSLSRFGRQRSERDLQFQAPAQRTLRAGFGRAEQPADLVLDLSGIAQAQLI